MPNILQTGLFIVSYFAAALSFVTVALPLPLIFGALAATSF
jgi:hypothetical protein